jgi:hypothetical protein
MKVGTGAGVYGHARVQGNEIADGLVRDGSGRGFLGPEPVLGGSLGEIYRIDTVAG